jgi:hypothetical protein
VQSPSDTSGSVTPSNHNQISAAKRSFNVRSFGVSDVVSFDFQHLFPNPDFSIIFIFQRIESRRARFVAA